MGVARYRLYTKKSGKLLKLMSLPPTEKNLLFHILRAHLQMIRAKSADQQAPLELNIRHLGWDIKDGVPVPMTSDQPPGPQDIMDVVRCGCKAEGNTCGTASCNCRHVKISCTVYCACACGDDCVNTFKREIEDERAGGDEQADHLVLDSDMAAILDLCKLRLFPKVAARATELKNHLGTHMSIKPSKNNTLLTKTRFTMEQIGVTTGLKSKK